jgi:hypothetical protein
MMGRGKRERALARTSEDDVGKFNLHSNFLCAKAEWVFDGDVLSS